MKTLEFDESVVFEQYDAFSLSIDGMVAFEPKNTSPMVVAASPHSSHSSHGSNHSSHTSSPHSSHSSHGSNHSSHSSGSR